MGLDVSYDCYSGSYTAFGCWRAYIATRIGLPLNLMQGYIDTSVSNSEVSEFERALISKGLRSKAPGWQCLSVLRVMQDFKGIPWSVLGKDPIVHLLDHSDCDGKIAVRHLLPLAKRLEGLLPLMKDEVGDNHVATTKQFIAGLRAAAEMREPVEFR